MGTALATVENGNLTAHQRILLDGYISANQKFRPDMRHEITNP